MLLSNTETSAGRYGESEFLDEAAFMNVHKETSAAIQTNILSKCSVKLPQTVPFTHSLVYRRLESGVNCSAHIAGN